MKIKWLGNAGFEFRIDRTTLLVDPFLTRPKAYQTYFGRIAPDQAALQRYIPVCDHILVTHAHFDHCMDAPAIAMRTGARVHGSANTCRLMEAAGLPAAQIHEVAAGDVFKTGDVRIRVLPAAHPWIPGYSRGKLKKKLKFPLRLPDYRMDACFSFLLEANGARILVWSSTHSVGAPAADLLTCRAVSSPRWYAKLLGQVRPRVAVPQHWDDFFQPLTLHPRPFFGTPRPAIPPIRRIDLQDFQEKVDRAHPNCRVLLPEIFQTYSIEVS